MHPPRDNACSVPPMSRPMPSSGPLVSDAAIASEAPAPLAQRVERLWRRVASGLSFVAFGVGGLIVGLLVLPLWLLPAEMRRRAARRLIGTSLRAFWAWMRGLRLFDCEIDGAEHLRENNILVIANHPTLIDAVLLIGAIPDVAVVAKRALADNPITGPALRAAGYIVNDDGAAMIRGALAEFARGGRILVFPESTRSEPGRPIVMQRGAANIAARASCRVVMVTIRVTEPLLHKGTSWYQMPRRRPRFQVRVSAPMDIGPTRAACATPARAARELTAQWQASCAQQLEEMERPCRGSAGEGNR